MHRGMVGLSTELITKGFERSVPRLDKPNIPFYSQLHRRSTSVSLETNPLIYWKGLMGRTGHLYRAWSSAKVTGGGKGGGGGLEGL